jgi:hypothetical protein
VPGTAGSPTLQNLVERRSARCRGDGGRPSRPGASRSRPLGIDTTTITNADSGAACHFVDVFTPWCR